MSISTKMEKHYVANEFECRWSNDIKDILTPLQIKFIKDSNL